MSARVAALLERGVVLVAETLAWLVLAVVLTALGRDLVQYLGFYNHERAMACRKFERPVRRPASRGNRSRIAPYGATFVTNVPQFAKNVRGRGVMYSAASQMLPASSATAAE